jgi:DNA-binding CsgD family transcriptional regulator
MSTLTADPDTARAKALRALEILEALGPSRALALCYSTLGAQDCLQARLDQAAGWLKRALDLAERLGSRDVVSHALGYRGLARAALGDEEGLEDLAAAVEEADRLGHGDYLTVAAHNLAVILFRTGQVREAKRYLDIGERAAREHALDTALFRIEAQQCHVLLQQGSWDEAERRLRRLLERSEDPGANLVNPLAFLGRILARRGDPEAAALIDRSWRLASATGEDQKMAIAAGARIEQIWLSGDDAAVRAVGAQLLALAIRAQNRYLRAEILRYLRRVGEPVEPFDGCLAPFAAGIEGDWAAAASGWERIGNPYHQALELTEAPELEAALRGLGMLDRLGAVATASLVRRRLRRGGTRGIPRGPRSATRANPGRLTDRQLEVLALLAEGSTNAEIAARLYLSRRTIDNHVAAVLARLGVSSRHDALQAATALGLLAPPGRET